MHTIKYLLFFLATYYLVPTTYNLTCLINQLNTKCRNLNLGFATKARACEGAGQK